MADAKGKNSRKSAPSTGRFPPTPKPRAEAMPQTPIHVGLAAMQMPKIPQIKRVMLKAIRRPTTSEAIPQKDAPRHRPMNKAAVVKRTWVDEIPNSWETEFRVKAMP